MNTCITEKLITQMYHDDIFFDIDSIEILEEYLREKLKVGSGNMETIRLAILRLFRYAKTTNLNDFNKKNINKYLYDLDNAISRLNKKYSYSYKKSHFQLLKAFFSYYEDRISDENRYYVNPFPRKMYKFTKPPIKSLEESEKAKRDKIFTIDEIKSILKDLNKLKISGIWFTQRQLFYISLLLNFCGMRISEVLTIKRKDLNLKERYLTTGTTENARKNKKLLIFIFPEEIIPFLQEYLVELNSQYPNSYWLFPSYKRIYEEDKWINKKTLIYRLHKIEKDKIFKTQMFRKSLTTYRLNDEKHPCPTHIEEALSNHAVSSIILKNYDQYSIEFRKRDYDKYLPENYREILEFLKPFY